MSTSGLASQHPAPSGRTPANAPWWRQPILWALMSGPLAVVVASIASGLVAWKHMDTVVGSGVEAVATPADPHAPDAPAMKARNHAASR